METVVQSLGWAGGRAGSAVNALYSSERAAAGKEKARADKNDSDGEFVDVAKDGFPTNMVEKLFKEPVYRPALATHQPCRRIKGGGR